MSNFSIQKQEREDGMVVLAMEGYLDAHTFEEFDNTINELFEDGVFKIIVDMAGVDYISSAGCGVFIGALGTAMENGGNIIPAQPTDNVKDVFDLLGLGQVLSIAPSIEEAVTKMNEAQR